VVPEVDVAPGGFEATSLTGSIGKDAKNGYLRYAELIQKLIQLSMGHVISVCFSVLTLVSSSGVWRRDFRV